jgi:NDP-sugar pyrophosphorylase family protein
MVYREYHLSITKAIILAAGEGQRMSPLTETRPKVMLPIANKPILEHLLIEMKKAGIREFVFVVGYHDERIRSYLVTALIGTFISNIATSENKRGPRMLSKRRKGFSMTVF